MSIAAQVVAIASASCQDVHEEVKARVQSPTWHDPHNGGENCGTRQGVYFKMTCHCESTSLMMCF